MAQRSTTNISDYLDDYEQAMQDYSEMGPLWAEMVFGDDFEAMKAVYGRPSQQNNKYSLSNNDQDNRGRKQR